MGARQTKWEVISPGVDVECDASSKVGGKYVCKFLDVKNSGYRYEEISSDTDTTNLLKKVGEISTKIYEKGTALAGTAGSAAGIAGGAALVPAWKVLRIVLHKWTALSMY